MTTQLGLFDQDKVTTAPAETPERCRPGLAWWNVTERVTGKQRSGRMHYQARCRPCQWQGPDRSTENLAVEDAMDHAWPQWREQPVMPAPPYGKQQRADWLEHARRIYPPGWVDSGGPILEHRGPGQTRHHDGTEWGGYSMAARRTP